MKHYKLCMCILANSLPLVLLLNTVFAAPLDAEDVYKITVGDSDYALTDVEYFVTFNPYLNAWRQWWMFKPYNNGTVSIVNKNGYVLTVYKGRCWENEPLLTLVTPSGIDQSFLINDDHSISPACNTNLYLAFIPPNQLKLHSKSWDTVTKLIITKTD